jgi:hypothetical protein
MSARVSSPERTRAIGALQRELVNLADTGCGAAFNAELLFDELCAGVYSEIKRMALEEAEQRARTSGRPHLEVES